LPDAASAHGLPLRGGHRAVDLQRRTVLGGVKGSLAGLGGFAALDPTCAPFATAFIDGALKEHVRSDSTPLATPTVGPATVLCRPPTSDPRAPYDGHELMARGTLMSTQDEPGTTDIKPCEERHFTVLEIAAMWNLSPEFVRQLIRGEPGVTEWPPGARKTTLPCAPRSSVCCRQALPAGSGTRGSKWLAVIGRASAESAATASAQTPARSG
jgi:hypothetical protein